jgi:hypothetical protein
VDIEGWGAAEFYGGIREYGTFWPAVHTVYASGVDNDTGGAHHCLKLTKSVTLSLSWSTVTRYDAKCKVGDFFE